MIATVDAPSVVPAQPVSDDAFSAVLSVIQSLIVYDNDLDKWFVENDDDPIYARIPGLFDHVRKYVIGKNHSKAQGGRWKRRQIEKHARDIEIAREYERRQLEYVCRGEHISATNLKKEVGRLPRFKLKRTEAIDAVDHGLEAINSRRSPSIVPGIPDK